jgi:hypothetical protein
LKKKLKLLLTKEEGKISKLSLALGSLLVFSLKELHANYSLDRELFNITNPETVQHYHNIIVRINETEPEDINFNYQKSDSCLVIYEVGAHRGWKDIENVLIEQDNTYSCNDNGFLKSCIVKGVRTSSNCKNPYDWDIGLVKYDFYY